MKFKYEGFRQGGTTMRGEVEAGTKEQACEKLRLEGIYLQQIVPAGEEMKTILPDPKIGTGPSEPAFLDTSLKAEAAAVGSAVSDSAFIPAVAPIVSPPIPTTQGFTGVPRETPQKQACIEQREPSIEVMSSYPDEGQSQAGSPPQAQETQLEPWQEEFAVKVKAFTMVMEEMKKYVQDEEMLKDVAKTNLGYIVGQTLNSILRSTQFDDELGETKESYAEKTKKRKKK